MVFSSFVFLFRFLPVFLLLYFIAPARYRNIVLFAGSLLFYAAGEGGYVILLILSLIVHYVTARAMYKEGERERGGKQKLLLFLALFYDFGTLAFFKYSGLTDKLPLGISFYTFQIAAYIIDVYRRRFPAERSFIDLGTYLAMFPQLVAGPIVNYSEVSKALKERRIDTPQFEGGLKLLIIGLGSKVILADRIGLLWNQIQAIGFESISTPLAWVGAFAYSMQLYFDFAGYSMMAVGLGKMLGFSFPENFNHPYMSTSVAEFWRRWHITLGRWFRDYVYIPMGGSREGTIRTMFNMFIVWSLTALWHGSSPNFLLWGGMLLFLLALEKLFLGRVLKSLQVAGHFYVVLLVPVTWIAFTVSDIGQILTYYQRMFPFVPGMAQPVDPYDYAKCLQDYGVLLFFGILFATPAPALAFQRYGRGLLGRLAVAGIFLLSIYYLAVSQNNPFLYFIF